MTCTILINSSLTRLRNKRSIERNRSVFKTYAYDVDKISYTQITYVTQKETNGEFTQTFSLFFNN